MAVLGNIKGQMILDVKQALASYTAARQAHLSTVSALSTGAGAIAGVSTVIAGAGVAMGAGIMTAVNAAAEFERKLDYFSAVSASTKEEYDAIREKALQLGQDTIYSAGEIADSFVELGKAGVGARDIIDGIGEGVASLGAAADIPLDTASNILMSAVQTFELGAGRAVEVADKLAGAANASIVEVQDLGISFKYAGGVANSLGLSFDDVNTALALLGTYGIKGSTAGTSLRQTMVSLTGSTKKATAQLMDLGIITEDGKNKFFDANGSAKSLGEIFQILQEATKDLSDEQRIAAMKSIFQSRALSTVLALTKEGAAGFEEMYGEINKTTALDVSSERLDNLSGDIEILRGNLETLTISAGSQVQEFARGIVQGFTDVIQWFTNLSDSTQKNILVIAAITAVILVVVGVLGLFSAAILQTAALALQLKPALAALKAGFVAVKTGVLAMNAAFWTSPITWIIAGIVALIAVFVLLWKNNEGFRNFWIKLWAGIKTAASAVWDWFVGLPEWFSTLWNNIKSTTSTVWNSIIEFFRSIPGFILDIFLNWTLPGLLIQHWDSIWATVQTVWTNIIEFFRGIPEAIVTFFSELPARIGYIIGFLIGTLVRLLSQAYNWAVTTVRTFVINYVKFWQSLPGKILSFLLKLYFYLVEKFSAMYNKGLQIIKNLYNGVIDWFKKLPGRVRTFLAEVALWVYNKFNEARSKAISLAVALYNGVIDWFVKLPGRVQQIFNNVLKYVTDKLTAAKNKAVEMGKAIFNGIKDGITNLPSTVTGIFNNVVSAIKEKITGAFNAVKDFASNMWKGFKDGLGINSPSLIEKQMVQITEVTDEETGKLKGQIRTLQGMGNNLAQVGANMGHDFTAGISTGLTGVSTSLNEANRYRSSIRSTPSSGIGFNNVPVSGSNSDNSQKTEKQVNLNVTWNAADNDSISNANQVKALLGQSTFILNSVLEEDE